MKPEQIEALKRIDEMLKNMSQEEIDDMNRFIEEHSCDCGPTVADLQYSKLLSKIVTLLFYIQTFPF